MTLLDDCLREMITVYRANPVAAVRGQSFIKLLHDYIADDLELRLHPDAMRRGVRVKKEVKLLGSHKPKDVDVGVIDPDNGPLVIVGVRSQMSSIGNNVLEYYQGIVGECISLQDRFPMSVIGYTYLHPLVSTKWATRRGAKVQVTENPDHARFAKMYNAITGRDGTAYDKIRGVYDQFAYMVTDFDQDPAVVRDDIVQAAVPSADLSIGTFVDRVVQTFKNRHIWLDLFK